MERKNAWKKYSDEDKNNVFTFADEYKTFISECKTERECVKKAVELAKKSRIQRFTGDNSSQCDT